MFFIPSELKVEIDKDGRVLLDEEFTETVADFKKWSLWITGIPAHTIYGAMMDVSKD